MTLLFTLVNSSIQGQSTNNQDEENYSSAYMQSSQTAHWSVYIPIAILVVAAIYLGIADKSSDHSSYSDSQDALGSIDNSKRHSTSGSGNSYSHYSSRNSNSYSSGYSHN